jgi:hypothetical protein
MLLGRVVGDVNAADGSPDEPRVELTEVGRVGGEQSLCLAVYQGKRRKSLHRRTLFVQSFWLLTVDFQ